MKTEVEQFNLLFLVTVNKIFFFSGAPLRFITESSKKGQMK